MTKKLLLAVGFAACLVGATAAPALAQAPAQESTPATQAAPPEAPASTSLAADVDIKGVAAPSADDRAKGDPGGTLTGTVADIPVADAKKGLTVGDVVSLVGQHQVAINFVWTLVAGFLVMFMQAGFAIVETGLIRAKNANHTMMMKDRKSTRLNSSHVSESRMPSSA